MSVPLLSTKFYIPPPRAGGVLRPRLTGKVLAGLNSPGAFTLLSGPAGFGKTTLLSEIVSKLQRPVAWVYLDEGDNDPIRFWSYLIAACQTVRAGVGESALALFQMPQPLPDETIPTLLINELAAQGGDMVLVLDDYHAVKNPAIHAAISFLLEHLPAGLHLVLSTRTDPPWPLARWRARNRLVEIRAQDLRFTSEEAAAFLNRMTGLSLTAEDVEALKERTEGWIAGLQLAAIALQARASMQERSDIAGFVDDFTGSHVYVAEYLVEEVLQHQPEEVQAFLLQTSILERLNAELCDSVIDEGRKTKDESEPPSSFVLRPSSSKSILDHLDRSNLFLVPLDDQGQWFRYHQLFADLLQARLRQSLPAEGIAALHQRAADWYEQAEMRPEAVEHALAARDYVHAGRLVEKVALPMILQAYVRTVEKWLQAIPPETINRSPRAVMAFAWLNLLRGTFAQAAPYLEHLETFFSAPGVGDEDPSLQGEWLAIRSKLLMIQGRPEESRDLASRGLQILPQADAHVRSMLLVNLASAYQQMLDYDHAAETYRMIVRDAQAAGSFVSETLGTSGQAQMMLQQGRLQLAFEIASEGIKRLESGGRMTPFGATLYGELGQIHYQWHQLERARSFFLRSIQTSGQSGYSDPEIFYQVVLSRMFQMEGNWKASAREMEKARELARAVPPVMVREEVISQQVRVDLARGHLASAQETLEAEGFRFEGEFGYPDITPDPGESARTITHPAGLLYNSALRVLLYRARREPDPANLTRGVELAARVLAGELRCRHLPIALETLLLRAQLHAALGNDRKSLEDVARALELAQPEGFISIFVEEGPAIAEALAALLGREQTGTAQAGRSERMSFLQDILAAFPGAQPPQEARREPRPAHPPPAGEADSADEYLALVEPLTPRELEVLNLIASGDSNRAIAEKLVITVSAVKKHSANIYGKLAVSSRTQAVARARQLGLLQTDS